ncbi:hypothetical protein [Nocardia sp. NPDC051570]|uniref:hypothetical protein n=1 Tax=Nocardia sp. NPDC051570 TaxID=3364324 RepID=UPI00378E82ED
MIARIANAFMIAAAVGGYLGGSLNPEVVGVGVAEVVLDAGTDDGVLDGVRVGGRAGVGVAAMVTVRLSGSGRGRPGDGGVHEVVRRMGGGDVIGTGAGRFGHTRGRRMPQGIGGRPLTYRNNSNRSPTRLVGGGG